jgi:hypothetical protein
VERVVDRIDLIGVVRRQILEPYVADGVPTQPALTAGIESNVRRPPPKSARSAAVRSAFAQNSTTCVSMDRL